MSNILSTSFLFLLIVAMVGCHTPSGPPILVEDHIVSESVQRADIIHLKDSNEHSSDNIWEQFFTERGGRKLWKTLKERDIFVSFDFEELDNLSEGIISLADELLTGSVNYLVWHQVEVGSLRFNHGYTHLTKIPYEIGKFTRLETLNLSTNRLIAIPTSIGNLTNLYELDLSFNQLQSLPIEIGNLTNLYDLNLSSNQFQSLPLEIGNLTNLRKLDLSSNQLISFPLGIGNITGLNYLDLSSNKLTSLSPEIGNLIRLRKLWLDSNQLQLLPLEIDNLTRLSTFRLSENQLQSIPSEIGKLIRLTELSLSENQLQSIPPEVGNLTNLEGLDLSENQLTVIPSEFCKLTSLNYLRVSLNQLKKLPASIKPKLSDLKLSDLDLYNNPWMDVSTKQLKKIDKQEIEASVYQCFPHTLLTLCMQYIVSNPKVLEQKAHKLPQELCQASRITHLKQAYEWKAVKNILFFQLIAGDHIPFYLDYPLVSLKNVIGMFQGIKEEQLYQFIE
jgi:Leucine-rich repeat (LRR) protein